MIITRDTTNIGFVTSAIETNLALITASAPALRPFFRSRARGGWFPRTLVGGQSRAVDDDPEMGINPMNQKLQKPIDWDNNTSSSRPGTSSGGGEKGGGTRGGRGGKSRGGGVRRGVSSRSTRSTRSGRGGGKIKPSMISRVKTDNMGAAELRSQSPRSSEEETMTNSGIMRLSDIQREIDGLAKEIQIGSGLSNSSRPYTRRTDSFAGPRPVTAGSMSSNHKNNNNSSTTNGNNRPGTSGGTESQYIATGAGAGTGSTIRRYPERYYSESVYPDPDPENYDDDRRDDRDYNDERLSRYGDRRFGVVTPRGTTPTNATFTLSTTRSWKEGGGRPF